MSSRAIRGFAVLFTTSTPRSTTGFTMQNLLLLEKFDTFTTTFVVQDSLAPFAACRFSLKQLHSCASVRCSSGWKFRHTHGLRYWESGCGAFLREGEFSAAWSEIDLDDLAQTNLAGCDQIRDRINKMPFNGAFQVTRTVFQVRTFVKQKFLCFRSASEDELPVGLRCHNPVLDVV